MATTSGDNLWTPDSGDDYALTVDLAAFADTVQTGLNNRSRKGAHWMARRTGGYDLATQGDMVWDSTMYDGTLEGFSTSNYSRFTCTVPGVYSITASAAAASTGTIFAGVFIDKNDAVAAVSAWTTNTTGVTSGTVSIALRFNVGDNFKIRATAGGPIAGQTQNNQTRLNVDYLRD